MKKFVYVLRLSEDGMAAYCYTNVKALYNGLIATGYNPLTIPKGVYEDLPFTYANLLKVINEQDKERFFEFDITCERGMGIEITNIQIKSH